MNDADFQPLLQIADDPSFWIQTGCPVYINGILTCSTGIFGGLTTTNITGNNAYFTTI